MHTFVCRNCSYSAPARWNGACPSCSGNWNILKLVRDGRATSRDAALLIELRRFATATRRRWIRAGGRLIASLTKRFVAVKK